MSATTTSMNDISATFPIKSLPTIQGEPTYASIHELMCALYANAASLPSPSGGGSHGHLGLIMCPSLYETLSPTPYNTPNDPGVTPTYPCGNITLDERTSITDDHKKLRYVFDTHHHMDDAIKSSIIDAVDNVYLTEKYNRYIIHH